MEGEKGKGMKRNAMEWKKKAEEAIGAGGSSSLNLDKLFSQVLPPNSSKEKLEAFLLRSMEGGLISDGVLAQDIIQALSFWCICEVLLLYMFVCIGKSFKNGKYDTNTG